MTIMFPSQTCAFKCTLKTYLLLKRQFKNNTWMKGICQGTTPILGSFVYYCKKRSYNRMIALHWALKHIALNTFNATYKGRFSFKSLNAVSHFSTLDC